MASGLDGVRGGGLVPGAWGPGWCRNGRAQNRRLRTVEVTKGPQSTLEQVSIQHIIRIPSNKISCFDCHHFNFESRNHVHIVPTAHFSVPYLPYGVTKMCVARGTWG